MQVAGFIVFACLFMEGHVRPVGMDASVYGRTLVCRSAVLVLSPGALPLITLYLCAPLPRPLLFISSSPPPLFTFQIMTRLLSDICYFGLADGIPNPAAAAPCGPISKAIATSSIISCHPSPSLISLPDDVLLLVISLIGVEDILALRMVCAHDLDSTQSAIDLNPLHRRRSALYRSPSSAGYGQMRSNTMSSTGDYPYQHSSQISNLSPPRNWKCEHYMPPDSTETGALLIPGPDEM